MLLHGPERTARKWLVLLEGGVRVGVGGSKMMSMNFGLGEEMNWRAMGNPPGSCGSLP